MLGRLQATVANLRSSKGLLRLSLLPSETPALQSARTDPRQPKTKSRFGRDKLRNSLRGRPGPDTSRSLTDTTTVTYLEQASAVLDKTDTTDSRLPSLGAGSDHERANSPVRRPRTIVGRSNTVPNMGPDATPRTSAKSTDPSINSRSRRTSDDDDNLHCVSPSHRRRQRPLRRSTTSTSYSGRKGSPGAGSDSGTEDSGGEGPAQAGRSIPLRPRVFVKDGKEKRMKRQKSFHIGGNAPDKPRKTFFLRESRFQYEGEVSFRRTG